MWTWRSYLVGTGGFLGALVLTVSLGTGALPARAAAGTSALDFPDPPQQHAPWIPPQTALPKDLVTATGKLFEQGLADPRGCEYRNVELMVGQSTGGSGVRTATRGWVLPATGAERRFAVCWNGLVYPLLSVGTPVDLRLNVVAVVETAEENAKTKADPLFTRGWSVGEEDAVSTSIPDRLRACLLLRLGEEELARRMWLADLDPPMGQSKGPYLGLATDWLWYLFDRTVGAHVRGDNPLALAGARLLVRARNDVEAEAARLGFRRPVRFPPTSAVGEAPYVDFGTEPAELLADQELRAAAAATGQAPDVQNGAPVSEARIAALVRSLNEVTERQFSQPGSVDLTRSPIVKSLLQVGDPAVTSLINCLESDPRLTRSVHYSRSFHRHRKVLPVRNAAFSALKGILKTSRFAPSTAAVEEDPKKLAGQIRAYWERYRGLSLEERWYHVLQDNSAGPEQWLEAAANITLPVDIEGLYVTFVALDRSYRRGMANQPAKGGVKGELLRAKNAPSVASLLDKRSKEVTARVKPDDPVLSATAVNLALCLSDWDARAAIPSLRREFRRCENFSPNLKSRFPHGFDADNHAIYLAELTLARTRGKDPEALRDYTRRLLIADPVLPFHPTGVFEPLWRSPDDPAVTAAAKTLFNAPASPWRRELELRATTQFDDRGLVSTPLLGIEGYRELIYRLLADRAPAGTATLNRGGGLEVSTPGGSGSTTEIFITGQVPKLGVAVPFRKCDFVAWGLSQIDGAPEFQLVWPEKARNTALPKITQFVRRYAARLRYSDVQAKMSEGYPDTTAALTFPTLGRPATPEDVRQTRAIFSLSNGSTTRLVKLPDYPMPARWTSLPKYSRVVQEWDETTRQVRRSTEYLCVGWVWQAEETLVNGKWQRYYGFVGPHQIVKVPADEIEFHTARYGSDDWGELTGGLDCQVKLVSKSPNGAGEPEDPPRLPAPPTIEVLLRNRGGLPRKVPLEYLRRSGSKSELLAGLEVRLWYSGPVPTPEDQIDPEAGPPKWDLVPPRPHGAFTPRERGKVLQPAESFRAFTLDLKDSFDLRKPGLYRLELVWSNQPNGLATGKSNELHFKL